MAETTERSQTKEVTVRRNNPLIRIPAVLFNGIDKRRTKIPIKIKFSKTFVVVAIDTKKLEEK